MVSEHNCSYHVAALVAKNAYFAACITSNSCLAELFQIVQRLLTPTVGEEPLEHSGSCCEQLAAHLEDKVSLLQSDLDTAFVALVVKAANARVCDRRGIGFSLCSHIRAKCLHLYSQLCSQLCAHLTPVPKSNRV